MTDIVLVAKLALGLASAAAAVALCRWRAPFDLPDARFTRAAMAALVVSRLGVWLILYVVLGLDVQSDVPVVYVPQAEAALRGEVVYAGIDSSYGPLFPYLIAVPFAIWPSAKAIVLFTILIETAAVGIWMRMGRLVVPEPDVRLATMLYVVCPVAILASAVNGLNQAWVMLAGGAACWLLLRGRDGWSSLTVAAGVLCVKILATFYAPALSAGTRRPMTLVAGLILPIALAYGALAIAGVDVLAPLEYESGLVTSGNLPFLLRALGVPIDGSTAFLVLGLALATAMSSTISAGRERLQVTFVHIATMLWLIFMFFSPKSHTNYLAMFLFPLCLTFAVRGVTLRRIGLFGGLMAVAAIEPSLHFRWFDGLDLRSAAAAADTLRVAVFLTLELLLLGGYAWLAHDAWHATRAPAGQS